MLTHFLSEISLSGEELIRDKRFYKKEIPGNFLFHYKKREGIRAEWTCSYVLTGEPWWERSPGFPTVREREERTLQNGERRDSLVLFQDSCPSPVLQRQYSAPNKGCTPLGASLHPPPAIPPRNKNNNPLTWQLVPLPPIKIPSGYFCMLQTQKQVDCASFHQFQLLRSWKKWHKNNKRAVFSQSDVKWGYSEQGADATQRACRGFFQTFSKEHQWIGPHAVRLLGSETDVRRLDSPSTATML